jgi:hypothetical protein
MIKFSCSLVLLFFAATASAQGFGYDELAGRVFWVRPTPEVFRRLEFYRQPNLNAVTFYPQGKKSFRIVNVNRGWIKLNFVSSFSQFEEAFIPLGYLKRNTYSDKTYNEYAFKRATFFNEDPDEIQERAKEATMSPAPTVKAKSAVSKFFRHKKKIDAMNQANQTSQKTPIPQQ